MENSQRLFKYSRKNYLLKTVATMGKLIHKAIQTQKIKKLENAAFLCAIEFIIKTMRYILINWQIKHTSTKNTKIQKTACKKSRLLF